MTVSSTATCPNPALLGPKFSLIEMTPIEYSPSFMQNCVPSLTSLATAAIIGFGICIVTGLVHGARMAYLVNKISSLDFPPRSGGAHLRDVSAHLILNFGPLESLTSQFPQYVYAILTARDPVLQNVWSQPFAPSTQYLLEAALNQADTEDLISYGMGS